MNRTGKSRETPGNQRVRFGDSPEISIAESVETQQVKQKGLVLMSKWWRQRRKRFYYIFSGDITLKAHARIETINNFSG